MLEKNTKLDDLVLYGTFRFYDTNKKIANACFYDNIICKYRLGYVIETRDNKLNETYTFMYETSLKYTIPIKDMKRIKEWCYTQKLN